LFPIRPDFSSRHSYSAGLLRLRYFPSNTRLYGCLADKIGRKPRSRQSRAWQSVQAPRLQLQASSFVTPHWLDAGLSARTASTSIALKAVNSKERSPSEAASQLQHLIFVVISSGGRPQLFPSVDFSGYWQCHVQTG